MRKTFPLCLLLLALTLTSTAAFAAPPADSCPAATATLTTPAPSPAALDLFGALSPDFSPRTWKRATSGGISVVSASTSTTKGG